MFGSEVNSFVRRVRSPLPFSGHKNSADLSLYAMKKNSAPQVGVNYAKF